MLTIRRNQRFAYWQASGPPDSGFFLYFHILTRYGEGKTLPASAGIGPNLEYIEYWWEVSASTPG